MEGHYLSRGLYCHFSYASVFPQDYEIEAEKLRSILDLENGRNGYMSKRPRLQSPAAKVKEEVSQKWLLERLMQGCYFEVQSIVWARILMLLTSTTQWGQEFFSTGQLPPEAS